MVKKSSKYSVHSGNTLKASGSRHTRRYSKQGCLTRKLHTETVQLGNDPHNFLAELTSEQNSLDGLMDNGLKDDSGIVYSLNKKGRWLLPELLKDHIHSDAPQDQNFQISLLEHHKLKKQANCISFHSSKGEITTVTAKKGYFNGQSVTGIGGSNTRRNRKKRTVPGTGTDDETTDEAQVPVLPEVRYEVFYPSPKTSSIIHNPKYITKQLVTGVEEIPDSKYKATKSKKHRLRMSDVRLDQDYMNDYDDYDYDDDDFPESVPDETDEGLHSLTGEAVLGLLLERALLARDLCNTSECSDSSADSYIDRGASTNTDHKCHYSPPTKYGKGTAIFATDLLGNDSGISSDESNPDDPQSPLRQPRATRSPRTMPTARVVLPSDQVTVSSLNNQFPSKYMEASCQPRKFAIDITSEVYEVCQRRHFIFRREEMWSWLVFTCEGMYDEGLQVFRVSVNSELVLPSTKLDTLFDMNQYTLEGVINSALMMVESCPLEQLSEGMTAMVQTARPVYTFDVLGSIKGWERETYHSNQSHKMTISSFIQTQPDRVAEAETVVGEWPEYCNICFSLIDPSMLDSRPATCLEQCEHWFCDVCWREHLLSTINRGSLILPCPEYDCDKCVDHATAVSLVSVNDYKNHLHHHHDNKVQREKTTKWCPNLKCGRVLLAVNGSEEEAAGMCVTCDCGLSICFTCLREAHWPANCKQAKKYNQKLKELGDENAVPLDGSTDVEVPVKYCPKCQEPINKNGGCPHVVCRCGHGFCWSCRADWPHTGPCKNQGNGDIVGAVHILVRQEDRLKKHRNLRSRLYLMSLDHRQYRQPYKLNKFRKLEMKIKSHFKNQSLPKHMRQSTVVRSILSKYGADADNPASIIRAVDTFVGHVARLHTEMHFVIEHTAVLMEDHDMKAPRRLLLHLVNRMDFLCIRIQQIFEDGPFQSLTTVMSRLQQLRTDARRCLMSLISIVSALNLQDSSVSTV